ncbi:hypothetical protein BDK92_1714 [Micromonospora pisi]|uniref:Big-1 domain-containing protein n=1 Tax=Micromonospora pisi TaxID=589240 RepID=A0A495JFV5_9ACTN|nr:hypothetical protein [Micromonospora pisi]RKR87438.1 hypothetical protein BDK92_1714 [Micromonospora pisi]
MDNRVWAGLALATFLTLAGSCSGTADERTLRVDFGLSACPPAERVCFNLTSSDVGITVATADGRQLVTAVTDQAGVATMRLPPAETGEIRVTMTSPLIEGGSKTVEASIPAPGGLTSLTVRATLAGDVRGPGT